MRSSIRERYDEAVSLLEQDIAATALRMVPDGSSATPTELLTRAMAVRLVAGHTASAASLRAAVALLRQQIEESGDAEPRPSPRL
jgi:hypothetical protein